MLRKAASSAPDSVVVLNNLAQTLSDLGRNEEALPIIERAAASAAGRSGPFAAAIQQTRQGIQQRLAATKKK
ncbi:MAG: hypothetical protein ACT4P4_20110 [Betaproteobacteria bacterium]